MPKTDRTVQQMQSQVNALNKKYIEYKRDGKNVFPILGKIARLNEDIKKRLHFDWLAK